MSILVLMILSGCETDPEGLAPPKESSTVGQAYYTSAPLTLDQLNNGVSLDSSWNIFIWTDELTENVPVRDVLDSVSNSYYYIYSYNERKYYFNPNQRYAQYNSHSYYSTKLISELKPSNKYGLYMASAGTLTYATNVTPTTKVILPNGDTVIVEEPVILYPDGFINRYEQTCEESDGGINYDIKGTVSALRSKMEGGGLATQTDSCVMSTGGIMYEVNNSDSMMREYYCDETGEAPILQQLHECEHGCEDGECKQNPEIQSCTDSDGGSDTCYCNYHLKTSPFSYNYSEYVESSEYDSCKELNEIFDDKRRFCFDEDQEFQTFNCLDSDGGKNIYEFGYGTFNTVYRNGTLTNSTWTDGCQGIGVRENYCSDDELWSQVLSCDNCTDGACINQTS